MGLVESAYASRLSVEAFAGYQRNQMFMDEARHFEACLAGRAKAAVPLEDGIAVLQLALAVKDAMRTSRTVTIN